MPNTLRDVIEDTQKLTGCEIERSYVDKGYRGHDAENPRRIFISGQKRGIFGIIKRELRRRSAIEPVIGHLKAEGHLGRCYLKGRAGDAANAILSAIGYNFRRILAWLRALLRLFMIAILRLLISRSPFQLLNGRLNRLPVLALLTGARSLCLASHRPATSLARRQPSPGRTR
jgi:IS5 family transposase